MDHDPYFAGRPPDKNSNEQKSLLTGWCIIYGLNLIVPLYFGIGFTQSHGRLGMGVAVLLMFGAGCCAVRRLPSLGRAINIGGLLVAAVQIFPILQVAAGFIGILWASNMGLEVDGPHASKFGGFVATVFTGGILIAVALLIGSVVLGVKTWLDRPRGNWNEAKKPGGIDLL